MRLNYLIANHRVVIEVEAPMPVKCILSNFEPFESTNEHQEPLYTFKLGTSLVVQGQADHMFESEELVHHIYIGNDGSHVIRFEEKGGSRSYLMKADASWREIVTDMEEESVHGLILNTMLMFAYAFSGLTKHTMMLHASTIVLDRSSAILFLGKSGTGKSTHSRLWLQTIAHTHLLNGDNPIVRIESQVVKAYGSPWSGKECCYLQESYPIIGVVRLTQAPYNKIERLRHAQAFAALIPSSSVMKWDEARYDALCRDVMLVATTVPIYRLECLPNEDAAQLCYQTIQHG